MYVNEIQQTHRIKVLFVFFFLSIFVPPLQNHLISNDKWLQKWNHAICARRSSFISVGSLVRYIIHSTRYQMLKQNDHTLHEIQLQNVSPTMQNNIRNPIHYITLQSRGVEFFGCNENLISCSMCVSARAWHGKKFLFWWMVIL